MAHGREDFTDVSLIRGQDALGNLVTIAVDASGNIIGLLKGVSGADLKTLATDADGRILARLMGRYGDTMIDISVDEGGKLSITEISQSNVSLDSTEAQSWTTPIANLLSNMNRIRYAIITMSGEAWGTFSHSIASTWAQIATAIGIHAALTTEVHGVGASTVAKLTDRMASKAGDATLGWTDEKLLKGAGAGVAPDEIDVPTGATTFAALTDVKVVRKTADETVNNSAVLQNDDHLLFAIAANEVWEFKLVCYVSGFTTSDLKMIFAVPAGAAGAYNYLAGGPTGSDIAGEVTAIATQFNAIIRVDGVNIFTLFVMLVNGGNAGNLQFQWAQGTAVAEDTKMLTNSCIIAHKLA